jgi:hypothetical protein
VRAGDVGIALVTAVCGIAVLWFGVIGDLSFSTALLLEMVVMIIPAIYLVRCLQQGGELMVPVLLMVATAAGGPIGAAGCTLMAFALWRQRPTPARLREWYDYISGVVERSQTTQIYDEVASGRVPPDPAASVHRLAPVLSGSSIAEQQRVLGVVGRRYHSELRPVLKRALRHRNSLVRAQAAAIASQLDRDEKTQLWANTPERVRDALETEAQSHETTQVDRVERDAV